MRARTSQQYLLDMRRITQFGLVGVMLFLVASAASAESAIDEFMKQQGWEGIRVEYTITLTTSLSQSEINKRWAKVEKYPDHPERALLEYMRRLKSTPEVKHITAWYAGNGAYLRDARYISGTIGGDVERSQAGRRFAGGGVERVRWMLSEQDGKGQLTKIHSGVPFPIAYNLNSIFDNLLSDLNFILDIGAETGEGEVREGLTVRREGQFAGPGGQAFYAASIREFVHGGRTERFELLAIDSIPREEVRQASVVPDVGESIRIVNFDGSTDERGVQSMQQMAMGTWTFAESEDRYEILTAENDVAKAQEAAPHKAENRPRSSLWLAGGIGFAILAGVALLLRR